MVQTSRLTARPRKLFSPRSPTLSSTELEWVRTRTVHTTPAKMAVYEDVCSEPHAEAVYSNDMAAPIWDSCVNGNKFVPGFHRKHEIFGDEVFSARPQSAQINRGIGG